MCEWQGGADGNRPQAYKQLMRKARKAHTCGECGGIIAPGDIYQFISGIWDGEPDSHTTCKSCCELRASFVRAHHGERPYLGALDEALNECVQEETSFDDDDNEVLTESGKRWRDALDEMEARAKAAKEARHV